MAEGKERVTFEGEGLWLKTMVVGVKFDGGGL